MFKQVLTFDELFVLKKSGDLIRASVGCDVIKLVTAQDSEKGNDVLEKRIASALPGQPSTIIVVEE